MSANTTVSGDCSRHYVCPRFAYGIHVYREFSSVQLLRHELRTISGGQWVPAHAVTWGHARPLGPHLVLAIWSLRYQGLLPWKE